MLASHVIQNCINDLKAITKCDLAVVDAEGVKTVSTDTDMEIPMSDVESFINSDAESQTINGFWFLKVIHEFDLAYIVISKDDPQSVMSARIAASSLSGLLLAYRDRIDKNNFFQNLILDNLLLVDIHNRAGKLHLDFEKRRVVYLVESEKGKDSGVGEMLKNIFSPQTGGFVTSVDEHSFIVIKELEDRDDYEKIEETANVIYDMLSTEVMVNGRVAYGTIVEVLKDVSKSYKEARMALEVGSIFYADQGVIAYNSLGIGRLIYQLPINLCRMFVEEIFGGGVPEDLKDEETLNTISMFLDNNLNVSETARQLYIHRNTLLYRLGKLEEVTGLDIRIFDDALTLKIALMVVEYMKYLDTKGA
ncbi:MAG: helix-turn-helix domain-containing protein [Lachnospiraceae bacterium]|nr:helix-turn-helix domain-containing protein [Lachnospiraceae bacterium]